MALRCRKSDTARVQIAPIQALDSGDFAAKAKSGSGMHDHHEAKPKVTVVDGDQTATALALIESTKRVVEQITELPPDPPPPGTLFDEKG